MLSKSTLTDESAEVQTVWWDDEDCSGHYKYTIEVSNLLIIHLH